MVEIVKEYELVPPNKSYYLIWLTKLLGVEGRRNELKKSLTHKSFYKKNDDQNSNGRYIFLGMFGFKGKVSEIVFKYVPGSGTQLQHFLGNLFKNDYLVKIFDKYHLDITCRYGVGFDIINQKHIMVYGFLGFLYENLELKKLEHFIVTNFIEKGSYLLNERIINKDLFSQCIYFSKLLYNKKPVIQIDRLENNLFKTIIFIGDEEISYAESISYRYSRKKALKQALLILSAPVRLTMERDIEYLKREEERKKALLNLQLAQKADKHNKYLENKSKVLEIKEIKKREAKKIAKEKEQNRIKTKTKIKERAEARQLAEAAKKVAMEKISIAKRRHIEDKRK